jgi:hypothetical protein
MPSPMIKTMFFGFSDCGVSTTVVNGVGDPQALKMMQRPIAHAEFFIPIAFLVVSKLQFAPKNVSRAKK